MNSYGKTVGKTATTLAATGATPLLGMSLVWTVAAAAGCVVVGALAVRLGFRPGRSIGQR